MTEWLTMRDAARRLGVSVHTISRAIRQHGLPAYRLGGRHVRLRPEDIDAWLLARPTAARQGME